MKAKKLPKISTLSKKLWKVFSQYIRERDQWTCVTCGIKGEKSQIHCGHFISKRHGILLKYDPRNVSAQCFVCNRFMEGETAIFSLYLIKKHGLNIVEELVSNIPISKEFVADRNWFQNQLNKYQSLLEAQLSLNEFGDKK